MKPSPPAPAGPATGERPAVSRRGRRWGSVLALIVLSALAARPCHLPHRTTARLPGASGPPGAAAARRPGPGRAAASGARSAPPSTVGIATARHADIPVFID